MRVAFARMPMQPMVPVPAAEALHYNPTVAQTLHQAAQGANKVRIHGHSCTMQSMNCDCLHASCVILAWTQ